MELRNALDPPSPGKSDARPRKLLFSLALLVCLALAVLALSGCATQETPTPAAQPTQVPPTQVPPTEPPPPPPPTEVLPAEPIEEEVVEPAPEAPGVAKDSPEYQFILASWKESPHGNTYDEGKGPNTYCSRCHSPQNWDPAATTGPAPNCVTCKFPQDETIRMATTMDFVPEEDWVGIQCETCHRTEGEIVYAEIAWLNPLTMEHESVATPNELCAKCHADTKGVSASGGRGVEHGIILGGSAHLNWGGALPQEKRPDYCSDCHDPHTLQPKQCLDCHEEDLDPETHMKGQSEAHANVTCMACHDASGLDVAPFPDPDSEWTTVLSSVSRSGETTLEYMHSHSIQWLVDCSRCHFEGNPWELSVLDADGLPVEGE